MILSYLYVQVKVLSDKLILENVTIQDAGWYICTLRGYQNILMAEAKLEVDKDMSMTTNIHSFKL